MLHVTNGDSAGRTLAAAGLPGAVLPWRDVLQSGFDRILLCLQKERAILHNG